MKCFVKNKTFILILIVCIESIILLGVVNLYIQNKQKVYEQPKNINTEEDQDITNSKTKNESTDNPIDEYFFKSISAETTDMRKYESIYSEIWKEEYNHLLEVLLRHGHHDIMGDINKLQSAAEEYIDAKSSISVALHYSSAFEAEYKNSENIIYGTLSFSEKNSIKGDMYRELTLGLLDEIKTTSCNMKYEYYFREENLTKDEQEFMHKIHKINKGN